MGSEAERCAAVKRSEGRQEGRWVMKLRARRYQHGWGPWEQT